MRNLPRLWISRPPPLRRSCRRLLQPHRLTHNRLLFLIQVSAPADAKRLSARWSSRSVRFYIEKKKEEDGVIFHVEEHHPRACALSSSC